MYKYWRRWNHFEPLSLDLHTEWIPADKTRKLHVEHSRALSHDLVHISFDNTPSLFSNIISNVLEKSETKIGQDKLTSSYKTNSDRLSRNFIEWSPNFSESQFAINHQREKIESRKCNIHGPRGKSPSSKLVSLNKWILSIDQTRPVYKIKFSFTEFTHKMGSNSAVRVRDTIN